MAKKCSFIDCNNPAEKKKNECQSCQKRKEHDICSACRQPEIQKNWSLHFQRSFIRFKKGYQYLEKLREKVPAQFRSQIDQVSVSIKLSQGEEKIVEEVEKKVLDFLAEKGGQQDNLGWFNFCFACDLELEGAMRKMAEEKPQIKSLFNRLDGSEKKASELMTEIKEVIGKEEVERITEEIEEELFGKVEDQERDKPTGPGQDDPTGPGNQGPGPSNNDRNGPNQPPNQKDNNSAKITQLQQQINTLKNEIDNLKNSRNPSPSTPETLTKKENELKSKEAELDELKRKNNPSKNQPNKDNPNWPLYLFIGGMGVIVVLLAIWLVVTQKKKKKNSLKLTK